MMSTKIIKIPLNDSWADWKGHSKRGEVPVNVRIEMLEKEEQAREALKVAIEKRLR